MDTRGAHPVMEIYNPGSEISLKRKLTAEPFTGELTSGISDNVNIFKSRVKTFFSDL